MSGEVLSVSQLLALAKDAIETGTEPAWVAGEITGCKRHQPSGHLYFDLKDSKTRVACVMWRDAARKLRFEPADGIEVRAHGSLGIYEVQGRLQLYVDAIEPAGLGELQAALERLKARLAEEGLFALERKRPLPPFPEKIGVVTSPTGAAVRDITRVLGERWPLAEVILSPCQVQGEGAAEQIARAMGAVAREKDLDLVILGRGGGSMEDLWTFNEETVVRAVAACPVPVVTGIGHEIDITLADLAADLRGATPSQAAEFAAPAAVEVLRLIRHHGAQLRHRAEARLSIGALRLSRLEGSHGLKRPRDIVRQRAQRLDEISSRLQMGWVGGITDRRGRLDGLVRRWKARDPREVVRRARLRIGEQALRLHAAAARWCRSMRERVAARDAHLEAVGPRSVLERGYAICLREADRIPVRSWEQVAEGESVEVVLSRGALGCGVIERREDWG